MRGLRWVSLATALSLCAVTPTLQALAPQPLNTLPVKPLPACAQQMGYEHRPGNGQATARREGLGVPIEWVWAPHGKRLGAEFRAEASFSRHLPVYTAAIGLSLGRP